MEGASGSVGAKDSAKASGMPCISGGCTDSMTGSGGEAAIMAATRSPIGASMLGGR
jgi:hypothetical protein